MTPGSSHFPAWRPEHTPLRCRNKDSARLSSRQLPWKRTRSFTVDIVLEVGDLSSTVEVTAAAGMELQKTDAQLANVMDVKMLRRLPAVQMSTLESAFPPTGNDARQRCHRRHRLRRPQRPEYAAARRDRRERQPYRRARRHVHAGAHWRRRHKRDERGSSQSKRVVWTFCRRSDHPQQ